jgi:hypothetical protein
MSCFDIRTDTDLHTSRWNASCSKSRIISSMHLTSFGECFVFLNVRVAWRDGTRTIPSYWKAIWQTISRNWSVCCSRSAYRFPYPSPHPLTRSRDTIPLSPLNWVSVLKLSTVWNFEDVRRKAIDSLAGFALDDPIARFLLLSQYNVEEWRIPTLNALARRTKPLDEYDSIRLQELYTTQGVLTFIMCVAEVRETFKPTRVAKMIAKPCIPLNEAHDCAVHSRPAKVDMCQSAFEEYHSGPMTTRAEHDFTEDICRVFGLPKAEHGPGHFPSTSCRGSGDSDCDETWLGWIWLCVTFAILLHGACLTLRSQPSSCHSIVESACKIQGFAY